MSKKVFFILPMVAIILAGCGQQTSKNPDVYNIPGQGQCFNDSECPQGYKCLQDNGSLATWCTKTTDDAGVIEKNPADDIGSADLNPDDDQSAPAVASSSDATTSSTLNQSTTNMPEMIIDKTKSYTAVLTTGDGTIEIALNASATPITVNNFVWLAKKSFYNNTVFHRTIKGFMIQGGDPKGDGTGGPGYQFNDEPFTGEYTRGTVAMANAGLNTNGSQFFIMQADQPLPKSYVIFGHVTKGLDVVDKIANAPAVLGADGGMSKPVTPVTIKSVTIIEK